MLFRSFQPLLNPFDFGAADYVELAVVVMLAAGLLLWRSKLAAYLQAFAARTGWCMLALAILPVLLRVLLLPRSPIPSPAVSDDFSYLLLADTLGHFRLANPPHALHQFFETFFVLQQPSYSSIFPLGQGLVLAIGTTILGHPWAGVALSIAAMCSLCYWMLRGWTTPGWALVGGALAVIQFGPLNQWMNSYWGGAVSAVAGCLVFGALPRLRERARVLDAVLLGIGLSLQLLTRPYELIFVAVGVALFFRPSEWSRLARPLAIAALAIVPAVALMLAQNKSVTGEWTTLPYQASRYQYGVPASFTTEPNPVPHRELTPQQQLNYQAQAAIHGPATDTLTSFFERLLFRTRYYRFFFIAPLYLVLPFFLPALRQHRFAWVLITLAGFAVGTNFYPYFYSHYIAAATCLFILIGVTGLQRLSFLRPEAASMIVVLCLAHFVFWYSQHLSGNEDLTRYETWDAINRGDPEARIRVNALLSASPGTHLVFVRYGPQHTFSEWIHNAADIDQSRVVWARDLGFAENEKLRQYYPGRRVWLLQPDSRQPALEPYR